VIVKKRLFFFIIILLFSNASEALEVKLIDRFLLSQDELLLLNIVDFAVSEDGTLFILDSKATNIKIYDKGGHLISVWGRRGPGPNEFSQPFRCDYKKPNFILYDFGKFKIDVYRIADKIKFEPISSIRVGHIWQCKLWNNKIVLAGYILKKNGEEYDLYLHDLENNRTDYILPSYRKYGFKSKKKYKDKYRNIAALGLHSYIDCNRENIYHIWEGILSIAQINISTKKIHTFGKETDNFKQLKVTKEMRTARRERNSKKTVEEKRKFSMIGGIFADEHIVGLVYSNYDKRLSCWRPIVQLYDPQGRFLHEQMIDEVVHYPDWRPPFFYNKNSNVLYMISRRLSEDFIDTCEIIKYKISQ
jgi:hypothetical protein